MQREGWVANIEMNTNTTGTSFEVRSEFSMATPDAAVEQLIERMLASLSKLLTPTTDRKEPRA